MKPLRTLMIGYGRWGKKLAPLLKQNNEFEIVGVFDPVLDSPISDPDMGQWVTGWEDALALSPEAVILATPASTHAQIAKSALEAGLHVFCEKPLTLDAVSAHEIVSIASARNLALGVDHQYWFSNPTTVFAGLIRAEAVGEVIGIAAERLNWGPARHDIDALWDLGVHDISQLLMCGLLDNVGASRRIDLSAGGPPGCVHVSGYSSPGVPLMIHSCWLSFRQTRKIAVSGTTGSLLLVENASGSEIIEIRGHTERMLYAEKKSTKGSPVELALEAFARSVAMGPLGNGGAEALRVIECLAALQSPTDLHSLQGTGCWLPGH